MVILNEIVENEKLSKPKNSGISSLRPFVTAGEHSQKTMENKWLADSGATHHMTHRREWLYNFELIEREQFGVTIGNDHVIHALGRGNMDVIATVNNRKIQHKLYVLFVPDIGKNLLSIGAAADNGIEARLSKISIKLMSDNNVIACGTRISDGLYSMNFETITNASANVSSASANEQVWHERYSHANYKIIRQLANSSAVDSIQVTDNSNINEKADYFCEACVFGKHCRKTFNNSDTRSNKPATFIHFDICGSISTESFGGTRFMALFVDDYTGTVFVYTMKSKADIIDRMKDVIAEANAVGHKIRRVRSDNAKEFIGKDMKKILQDHSILHEVSTAYCPEQNSRAERQNRTIIEMT